MVGFHGSGAEDLGLKLDFNACGIQGYLRVQGFK